MDLNYQNNIAYCLTLEISVPENINCFLKLSLKLLKVRQYFIGIRLYFVYISCFQLFVSSCVLFFFLGELVLKEVSLHTKISLMVRNHHLAVVFRHASFLSN